MTINKKNIDLLKRAYPHLDTNSQKTINVLLKFQELQNSITNVTNLSSMEACDSQGPTRKKIDMEALLNSIKPACAKKERELIDFALNINKAKDMVNVYKSLNTADFSPDNLSLFKDKLSPEELNTINQLKDIIPGGKNES